MVGGTRRENPSLLDQCLYRGYRLPTYTCHKTWHEISDTTYEKENWSLIEALLRRMLISENFLLNYNDAGVYRRAIFPVQDSHWLNVPVHFSRIYLHFGVVSPISYIVSFLVTYALPPPHLHTARWYWLVDSVSQSISPFIQSNDWFYLLQYRNVWSIPIRVHFDISSCILTEAWYATCTCMHAHFD